MIRVALLAMLALPLAVAGQTRAPDDPAAYAKLPVCKLAKDGRSLAVEPCRTAPAHRPMPRRPVPHQAYPEQHIGLPETTPPQAVIPAAVLEPRSPYPTAPVPPVPPSVNPSPYTPPPPGAYANPPPGPTRPSPAACVGGVCRDAAGNPYSGNGPVLKGPTGRPCVNSGGFVSCM